MAVCIIGVYLARAKVGTPFGASAEANVVVIRYLPFFLATLAKIWNNTMDRVENRHFPVV